MYIRDRKEEDEGKEFGLEYSIWCDEEKEFNEDLEKAIYDDEHFDKNAN